MIKLTNLTKKYSDFTAVDNVNLQIEKGEIFGFLGPNGAGKTTTINMIVGLLKPTSGSILIDNFDIQKQPEKAKQQVGFIPDRPSLYEKLTGLEFLHFIARLYKVPPEIYPKRSLELLEFFDLLHWKDELIEEYSHGMKQRLLISSAFIHDPPIIVVDEPMVGLDPRGSRLIKDLFKEKSKKGMTIFMSTHSMEVAEELCDNIAIINEGKIIAQGNRAELHRLSQGDNPKLEAIFLKLTGGEEPMEE